MSDIGDDAYFLAIGNGAGFVASRHTTSRRTPGVQALTLCPRSDLKIRAFQKRLNDDDPSVNHRSRLSNYEVVKDAESAWSFFSIITAGTARFVAPKSGHPGDHQFARRSIRMRRQPANQPTGGGALIRLRVSFA